MTDDIQAAIEAGRNQIHRLPSDPILKEAVVIPEKFQLVVLPQVKLEAPRFLTAKPVINDTKAFIDYFNYFKRSASRIFYTQAGEFTGVLDYHLNTERANHGDHIAVLSLKRSPEWLAWSGKSERLMNQTEFAEFIEDHARDILTPDPTTMLEVATGLHANTSAKFRSAINQANGTVQMQYDEETAGTVKGSSIPVPTQFQIGVRPFMGTERYPIDCRYRYRIDSGNLRMMFKCLHMEDVTETAMDGIVGRIRDETGVMPALGAHDPAEFARGT